MLLFAMSVLLTQAPQVSEWTHLPTHWDAHLESAGGELEFGLRLELDASGATRAKITNASEVIDVPHVEWSRERLELVLEFPHYDSRIVAKASSDGVQLTGQWRKRKSAERWTEMTFGARVSSVSRDRSLPAWTRGKELDGTWSAKFASEDTPAVARFSERYWRREHDGFTCDFEGTFLTTLGDYRYLSGEYRSTEGSVVLSCFDGAHAFLFNARILEDGSLAGEFWSGDTWFDTWTAARDRNAALPDPFGLTQLAQGAQLDELSFPDVDGVVRKLGDAQFAGKARIVQLFGTWCPNCNDETRYLVELHERFGARGLSILGLAFELTGDFARDAGQVRKYAAHHGVRYPLLVAGESDKHKASQRFPLLDKLRAYPTTLFVDARGVVRAVHQGFNGPATGAAHAKLREDFERLIEGLLAEAK